MDISNSILEKVQLQIDGVELFFIDVKRDDLIDPIISGNKWRKLKYNILQAKALQKKGILTYGGAFSNHLVATAKAAQLAGIKSIGIVRGEELTTKSNNTLKNCHRFGMELHFVDRQFYKSCTLEGCKNEIQTKYPDYYVVPEGGKNFYGVIGCQEIMKETPNNYNRIYLAGGTGTTAAGILLGASNQTEVYVISALKGDFLKNDIQKLLYSALFDEEIVSDYLKRLIVISDNQFGGYAKTSSKLFSFINDVYHATQLKLDPVYTGKAFFQLAAHLKKQQIKKDEKILFIHTGGLQGAVSWEEKIDFKLSFENG